MLSEQKKFFERNAALFSYTTGEYKTPIELYNKLNTEFHFLIDAATTPDNPLGTEIYYTAETNGLNHPWDRNTFVNPPYGSREIIKWVQKAWVDSIDYGITVVMLLPVRTDVKWFHMYCYKKQNVEIRFIKGRLKFDGATNKNTAPFPSMLCIFRG